MQTVQKDRYVLISHSPRWHIFLSDPTGSKPRDIQFNLINDKENH